MFSFLLITHGELGQTLVRTAEFIMKGNYTERTKVVSIDYSMLPDMDKLQEEIRKSVEKRIRAGEKVIIFVDIFGGSPSNVAFTLAKKENVDIVSGVNLPMVIYAFEHMDDEECDLSEMVAGIVQCGSDSQMSAKKLLMARERR